MKNITIGYLKPQKETFISNIIYTNDFLNTLSCYVKVVTITTGLKDFNLRKLGGLNIDYLLTDIKNFGARQFILRERQKINIPFVIILHTVYAWFESLVQIIPLIRKEDLIIAPSEYAKNSFSKITKEFKVPVIPHCLDIRQIQQNISCYNKDRKEIAFMGRLIGKKGIGVLIDCMPEIIRRAGDAYLNIIGPLSGSAISDTTDFPKSPFVKRLETKVQKLGLTNNVHFMGLKLGLEKYKILSEANVLVNPTTSPEENFPVTNIDALACGLPVIATRWAGNNEIIKDGKNGYLIDIDYDKKKPKVNTKQLISKIINVLRDKRLNLKLRKNAMESSRDYDYRKVMPKLIKLLKKRKNLRVKNSWELIRNRRVTDFSHLFNRDFLFFLYYRSRFQNEKYSSLYKIMFESASLKNRLNKMIKCKSNTKDIRIMRKIQRNFSDLLLLKSG